MTALTAGAPARSPWQRFYGAVLARRRRLAAAHAERRPVPVVSLGNLHWGGGGKTPFTAAVAADLSARGLSVAIVSRGYRRSSRGPLVVSLGAGPRVSWSAAGDEPFLLAELLPGVAVAVGEQRVEAARLLLRELAHSPDLFLLDDGFSHVALARDIELLLFPAADPFAGSRLAPAGRLREPLSAARHADAVVLTGAPANGDSFSVAPSSSQSVFVTLAKLIGALEAPSGTPAANARLGNETGFALTNLDQGMDNILRVRAQIGARLAETESLGNLNEDLKLQYQQTLSQLQDLDYAKAIADLTRKQTDLQAAQQSFARISQLSLFNYL